MRNLIFAAYALSGVLAYGHCWNNSAEYWEIGQRFINAFASLLLSPIYWSVVLFGG